MALAQNKLYRRHLAKISQDLRNAICWREGGPSTRRGRLASPTLGKRSRGASTSSFTRALARGSHTSRCMRLSARLAEDPPRRPLVPGLAGPCRPWPCDDMTASGNPRNGRDTQATRVLPNRCSLHILGRSPQRSWRASKLSNKCPADVVRAEIRPTFGQSRPLCAILSPSVCWPKGANLGKHASNIGRSRSTWGWVEHHQCPALKGNFGRVLPALAHIDQTLVLLGQLASRVGRSWTTLAKICPHRPTRG